MNVAQQLRAEAGKRILVKDGAYGTQVQNRRLSEADYRGTLELGRDQKGNNDLLNLTRPDIVASICQAFSDAGAELLATNSFNANRISQADYGAEHLVREINVAAARIIAEVADREAQKDGRKRWVVGALGPTNKTLSLSPNVNDPGYREIDFDTLSDVYVEQIESLVEGGAEIALIETVFDTLNAKAAIHAAQRVDRALPIMLSMTITDLSGRNLSGHSIEAFWASVRHARPLSVGLNCSFGAGQLRAHVAALSGIADTLIMAYPNAGLPNDLGEYDEGPAETAAQVRQWCEQGIVNVVGGCCGTTPAHIAAIAEAAEGFAPRTIAEPPRRTVLAGIEPMVLAA
ncbi:MAG: 5-methyltetrahydrofolate--homocysteine methyltransferase [Sphingomonadales bacterium]|jgi:5-methyltetrahydrofolate--homocysteine methyltransferase|nr:5-methyltetrahydrofolate--homocysteine methyltransferase [Sphingomonadales bacterium]